MKRQTWFATGAATTALMTAISAVVAQPAPPPPIANYWVDVATSSGLGTGMTPGARPDMSRIMGMMQGGSSVSHTLDLRLASRNKAPAPAADHFIPQGLQMGASLPLVTPAVSRPVRETPSTPYQYEQPKGRMLIYWGCGEHVGPGQPTELDFSKLAAGQVPPGMAAFAAMGRGSTPPQAGQSAGLGQWPNDRDARPVPVQGSLLGAHKVEGNYLPPIAFSLAAGQDFMPDLGLVEAGSLPSGASRLAWRAAPQATGYALTLFGSAENGDVIVWTSSSKAASAANLDYLPPAEVKRLVTAGAVLPPTANQCLLPAEVSAASPSGIVMMIGYGPEVHFAEAPKAPKWTTRLRYKTTASLIRGMGAMGGMDGSGPAGQPGQPPQPKKKKKKFGIGDVLGNVPLP